jgi:hypothetical protein
MTQALGFVDLAEELDPCYDWVEAYSRTGTKPGCLVGFTIGEYEAGWFVAAGDNPVAMLKHVGDTWLVSRHDAERSGWQSDVPHQTVASALDHLIDVMNMFLSARDIEDLRSKVRVMG